jgi:hypothetical protein
MYDPGTHNAAFTQPENICRKARLPLRIRWPPKQSDRLKSQRTLASGPLCWFCSLGPQPAPGPLIQSPLQRAIDTGCCWMQPLPPPSSINHQHPVLLHPPSESLAPLQRRLAHRHSHAMLTERLSMGWPRAGGVALLFSLALTPCSFGGPALPRPTMHHPSAPALHLRPTSTHAAST